MLSVDDRSLGDTLLGLALGFCDAFVSWLVLTLPLEFEFTVVFVLPELDGVLPELDGAPPVSRPFEICAVAGATPMTSAASDAAAIETCRWFMRIPLWMWACGWGSTRPSGDCTAGASGGCDAVDVLQGATAL
jgi:hypothetical protein